MQHELLKFKTLVELGSYSKAAKQMHVSQPALSIAIRQLEKQLGVRLHENRKPSELTVFGVVVYETVVRLNAELRSMQDALKRSAVDALKLRLGAIDSVASNIVRSPLHAKLLSITVDNSTRLCEHILSGQIDLAIITTPTKSLAVDIQIQPLASEPFCLVTKKTLVAEVQSELDNQQLTSMLAYNIASTTHRHMVTYSNSCGITMVPKLTSTSPELLKQMAAAGHGCSLLPRQLVASMVSSGELVEVSSALNDFNRPLSVVYNKRSAKLDQIVALATSLQRLD